MEIHLGQMQMIIGWLLYVCACATCVFVFLTQTRDWFLFFSVHLWSRYIVIHMLDFAPYVLVFISIIFFLHSKLYYLIYLMNGKHKWNRIGNQLDREKKTCTLWKWERKRKYWNKTKWNQRRKKKKEYIDHVEISNEVIHKGKQKPERISLKKKPG